MIKIRKGLLAVALAVVAGSIVNSVHAQNPTGRVEVKKDYETDLTGAKKGMMKIKGKPKQG